MNAPDETIHQPVRLRIMAALTALRSDHEGLDFTRLKTLTGASDGNLGQTLGIELTNNSSGGQVDYDLVNLSFTPLALPLPGALSLFAGGLALMTGLTGRRRRKRQPRVA